MDIKQEIKAFLDRHETTGWIILLMVGGLVLQGLILVIMTGLGVQDSYQPLINKLVLPYSFGDWFTQPWSIFTFPFFSAKIDIFRILVSGLIIYAFGRIHQQLLGNTRTKRLIIFTIPLIGLLTITFSSIASFEGTTQSPKEIAISAEESGEENTETYQEQPEEEEYTAEERKKYNIEDEGRTPIMVSLPNLLRVSGFMPVIMVLVISTITLMPNFPIRLFLFGEVKILWVGIVLLVIELLWATFLTPFGIAIAIGALLGYLHIYFLKDGTDLTEIIWSYYQDSRSKPKMTVKYGDKKAEKKNRKSSSQSQVIDTKGGISQDIVDKILDKINAKGYESLSREEKELLFKASQKDDEK